jgi:hypothetical protein
MPRQPEAFNRWRVEANCWRCARGRPNPGSEPQVGGYKMPVRGEPLLDDALDEQRRQRYLAAAIVAAYRKALGEEFCRRCTR